MTTEKKSASHLINEFVSRWDEVERIRREQAEAVSKLNEASALIIKNGKLTSLLRDTGVAVGMSHRQRSVVFDTRLKDTVQPLVVIEPPEMPHTWELDDLLKEEAEVPDNE
ncbi:MAG: hypothetical protein ACQES7_04235 [Pseudomonadota bacterium]